VVSSIAKRYLFQANPWWRDKKKIERDTYILSIKRARVKRNYEEITRRVLSTNYAVITGPLFTGKTTLLKFLIAESYKKGLFPIYLPLGKQGVKLSDLIHYVKNLSRNTSNTALIVDDANEIDLKTLEMHKEYFERIYVASSLKILSNEFNNFELLPLSFPEYAENFIDMHLRKKTLQFKDFEHIFDQKDIIQNMHENTDILNEIFRLYLASGGIPRIVEWILRCKETPMFFISLLYKRISADMEPECIEIMHDILTQIIDMLSISISVRERARKLKKPTDLLETCLTILERNYIIGKLYNKELKVYLRDPFYLHTIYYLFYPAKRKDIVVSEFIIGGKKGYLVESIVFEHLYRIFGCKLRSLVTKKGEIDFVVSSNNQGELGIEVKYREHIRKRDILRAKEIARSEGVRVIILSKKELLFLEDVFVIPLSLFLYMFRIPSFLES